MGNEMNKLEILKTAMSTFEFCANSRIKELQKMDKRKVKCNIAYFEGEAHAYHNMLKFINTLLKEETQKSKG